MVSVAKVIWIESSVEADQRKLHVSDKVVKVKKRKENQERKYLLTTCQEAKECRGHVPWQ